MIVTNNAGHSILIQISMLVKDSLQDFAVSGKDSIGEEEASVKLIIVGHSHKSFLVKEH